MYDYDSYSRYKTTEGTFMVARNAISGILVLLVFAPSLNAQQGSMGSICLSPVTAEMRQQDLNDPTGKQADPYEYKFTVQVDDQKPVAVSESEPVLIAGIKTGRRHAVRIRDADRLIESFYFTFEERGSRQLCLSYGAWYQTWRLERPGRRPWCKCQ